MNSDRQVDLNYELFGKGGCKQGNNYLTLTLQSRLLLVENKYRARKVILIKCTHGIFSDSSVFVEIFAHL